jgi:hypothetical protein
MKQIQKLFALVLTSMLGGALARAQDINLQKSLCPSILIGSGIKLDTTVDYVNKLYQELLPDGTFGFLKVPAVQEYVARLSQEQKNYNLQIDVKESGSQETLKTMELQCPLPMKWDIWKLPKIDLVKPNGVLDGSTKSYRRFGLMFSSFDIYHEDTRRIAIFLFWRYRALLNNDMKLPPQLDSSSSIVRELNIDKRRSTPLLGVRLGKSPKLFTGLWHVSSDKKIAELNKLVNGNIFTDISLEPEFEGYDAVAASKVTLDLDHLNRFNTDIQRYIPCEDINGAPPEEDCLAMNMVDYGSLVEAIKTGDPIYVQLLLKLDRGFLLQTYELLPDTPIRLFDQKFVERTETLRLPEVIFN